MFLFFPFPNGSQTMKDSYCILPCCFLTNFIFQFYSFVTVSRPFCLFQNVSHTDHNSSLPWDVIQIFLWVPEWHLSCALKLVSCPSSCSSLCCHWLCCFARHLSPSWVPEPNKCHGSVEQRGRPLLFPYAWLSFIIKDGLLGPWDSQSLEEFWWNYCLIVLLPSPLHWNQVLIWGGGIAWISRKIQMTNKTYAQATPSFWFSSIPRCLFVYQPTRHTYGTWIPVMNSNGLSLGAPIKFLIKH